MIKTKATTDGENTVELTGYDRALGRLVDLSLDVDKDPGQVNLDLASDAFWECFKSESNPVEEIPQSHQLNRTILDWLKSSNTWTEQHSLTSGSLFTSAVTAGLLYQGLTQDEVIQAAMKKQAEAEKAREESEAAQAAADALKQAGKAAEAAEMQKLSDKMGKKASDLQGAAQAAVENYAGTQQGQASRSLINQEAKKGTDEATGMMTGWGSEPSNVAPGDVGQVMDQLKSIKNQGNQINQITALMGRVKGLSMKTRSKKVKRTGTIVKDGYTQDLTHVFPSELALLRPDVHPLLRAQKMGEYADRGLLGMIEGTESVKEGDVVMAVDESSSMRGMRIIKAKALALGMAQAAKENGQGYHLFSFATGLGGGVNSNEDWLKHVAWAGEFMNGGTSFDLALTRAMDQIETLSDPENTDIVIITDGESGISPEVVRRYEELKERCGTRLIGLMVGSDITGRYSQLPQMATTTITIGDYEDLDSATVSLTEALERE